MDKTKDQMEFLFEEGGMADDGLDRDPVSGNEVPSGSMSEEVRDDIPAQLSEGEYVVPADVVRYYGVRFFEDLRKDAKKGLTGMEREGRIGGEPVDMEGDDTGLTPEEMAELDAIMGMAVGGYVEPAPQAIGNTDYMQGQPRQGFQEGGAVASIDPSPLYQQFGAGVSFMGSDVTQKMPSNQPSTSVILYGPNGEIQPLELPADQIRYDELIRQGYSLEQAPAVQQLPSFVQESDEDGSGSENITNLSDVEPPDLSSLSTEELQSNLRGIDTMRRIGGGLASILNPVIGAATHAAIASNRVNIVQELESRGVDMSDYREEHGRDLFGGGLSMYDGLQDVNDDGEVDFGDTWLGDLLGFDGRAGVQGASLKDSRDGARRGSTPIVTRTSSSPAATRTASSPAAVSSPSGFTPGEITYGGGYVDPSKLGGRDSDDDGGGFGSKPSSRSSSSSGKSSSSSSSSKSSGKSSSSSSKSSGKSSSSSKSSSSKSESRSYGGFGGLKDGGFVSRRNKK